MTLNWKEINLILEEIGLPDYFIQKIRQPDYYSLVLDIYKPGCNNKLLISLRQGKPGIFLTDNINRITGKLQRFAQLLRSRISGSRITFAGQIDESRIIKISVSKKEGILLLYIILRGNTSNIILCDEENRIIDLFYRRPVRGEKSGEVFNFDNYISDKKTEKEFTVRDFPNDIPFHQYISEQYENESLNEEFETVRNRTEKLYESLKSRLLSRLDNNNIKSSEAENFEIYKQKGEILLSEQHKIDEGCESWKTFNFFTDNTEIEIELDPDKSVFQNSDIYFKKYKKSKSAHEYLKSEIENVKKELDELENTYNSLKEHNDISEYRKFLKNENKISVIPKENSIPGLQFASHGFVILVGRNARENDLLLRNHVKGNDFWMHTRDYPGGFVFIKALRSKSVPLEVLLDAGQLAVHFSKAKNTDRADLYYT